MAAKDNFIWTYPKLIAHRGGGILAPENTMAGMRCGYEHGFDMFEFDVKLSKDNMLVIMHDDSVNRTSNGKGAAAKMTFNELSLLDFGSWHSAEFAGESIPTLNAVASYTKENHIICNIEIKPCPRRETQTGQLVAQAAKELWKNSSVAPLFSSFSQKALAAAQKEAPEFARAFLDEKLPANFEEILERLDCVAINLDEKTLTKADVVKIHKAGYKVCVWTVNSYSRAKELFNWGVDAIFTDQLRRIPASMA